MKTKILILSSLLCMCGANYASASECVGAGCDIEPMVGTPTQLGVVSAPVVATAPMTPANTPMQYVYLDQIPMQQTKLLSIKPVEPDNRPALWDGVQGKYTQKKFDKTVDWRDGVPIWDDSIVSYRDKDFSFFFLEP